MRTFYKQLQKFECAWLKKKKKNYNVITNSSHTPAQHHYTSAKDLPIEYSGRTKDWLK